MNVNCCVFDVMFGSIRVGVVISIVIKIVCVIVFVICVNIVFFF